MFPYVARFRAPSGTARRFKAALRASFCGALLAAAVSAPVPAQEVLRIAAVVNDEVISIFDLTERVRLVLLSSNLPDTPEQRQRLAPQVLRGLIDEQLQLQEADRLNVRLNDAEFDGAISIIEQNNNIAAGGLADFATANGLSIDAVEDQIRASATWQKVISRRLVPTIQIGNDEVDVVLDRIAANRGRTENRLAEIVLPIDNPSQDAEVRATAEQLVAQLRGGANFAAVARQFSQSASAAAGGEIGWVQEGQLDPAINEVLPRIEAGQFAGPIAGPDAYRIIFVIDRRQTVPPAQEEIELKIRQLLLSLPADAAASEADSQLALARQISAAADSCDAFAELSVQAGVSQPDEPTTVRLGDLNDRLQTVVTELPVNVSSEPARTGLGVQVIMVCERDDSTNVQARNAVRDTLTRERVDMLARRYIRDLQRAAFIDLRI